MIEPKFTREELEARQQARGAISIDTVRDYMCFENPTATPEEAAFALWKRYPTTYSYEAFLKSTRLFKRSKTYLASGSSRDNKRLPNCASEHSEKPLLPESSDRDSERGLLTTSLRHVVKRRRCF